MKILKLPEAPGYFTDVAKNEWERMGEELLAEGRLDNLDLTALEAYCATYSTYIQAQEKLKDHGVLIKAQSGFPMQSPYLQISNKAMSEMRRWWIQLKQAPGDGMEEEPVPEIPEKGGSVLRILHNKTLSTHRK